jgi:hypothetical protein
MCVSMFRADRKVAGSIRDKGTEFFNLPDPSSPTMALGLTQSLTEMSTRKFSWGIKADNPNAICETTVVCFLWDTNWTVSTATGSQYLAVNCEPIV